MKSDFIVPNDSIWAILWNLSERSGVRLSPFAGFNVYVFEKVFGLRSSKRIHRDRLNDVVTKLEIRL